MRCQVLLCVDFLNSEARQPSFYLSFNKKKINIGIFQVALSTFWQVGYQNKQSVVMSHSIRHLGEREINFKTPELLKETPKLPLFFMLYTLSQTWQKLAGLNIFFLLHSSLFLQFGSTSGTFQNSFDEMLLCVIIDFSSRVKQEVYVHISDINTTTLSKCYTSLSQSSSENINIPLIDLQAPKVDGMRGHAGWSLLSSAVQYPLARNVPSKPFLFIKTQRHTERSPTRGTSA